MLSVSKSVSSPIRQLVTLSLEFQETATRTLTNDHAATISFTDMASNNEEYLYIVTEEDDAQQSTKNHEQVKLHVIGCFTKERGEKRVIEISY